MRYSEHLGQKEIWFEVFENDAELLDKLAFIHLIAMKFEGEEVQASVLGDGNDRLILINLHFLNWDACSDAKAHCDRNTEHGCIVADYKGALDRADPSRMSAKSMKERAELNTKRK